MTSIFNPPIPQTIGLAAAVGPWEKFDWSEEIQKKIYGDWGKYYFLRREHTAFRCFNSAMELDRTDYKTLFARARVQRKIAGIEGALKDARKASDMANEQLGPSAAINTEICELLFEMNKLEDGSVELNDNMRFFVGHKSKGFETRNLVTQSVIKDVLGKSLREFFKINRELVLYFDRLYKEKSKIDDTLLWKKLRDLGKCDTHSIPENEEEILSPLEKARRARAYNIFHQTYLKKNAIDVLFLKELRKNPCLLLEQCHRSNGVLKVLSETQYDIVRRFMKMLHTRMPLYYVNHMKYTNKKVKEKCMQETLYRWQYKTHRNMINNLRHIRKLREQKRLPELAKYVESVMGDYTVLKTDRVMCWKFEFMNEVYNNLALAIISQYTECNLKNAKTDYETLNSLLHLPKDKLLDIKQFVFGDRSTYEDKNETSADDKGKKKLVVRLEERLKFAKYPIERAYLNHQIAGTQLSLGSFEECCYKARQALRESKECNNYVWQFLSVIQMLKANASQHKLERTSEALQTALPIAETLKNQKLTQFILFCSLCIEDETLKKNFSMRTASQISSARSSKSSTMMGTSPLASNILTASDSSV